MFIYLLTFIHYFLATDREIALAQAQSLKSVELTYVVQPGVRKFQYLIQQGRMTVTELSKLEAGESIQHRYYLTNEQSGNYYNMINSLQIDTLEQYYDGGGFDGFDLLIKISSATGKNQFIGLHNFKHPVISKLIDVTNKLIPESRLRIKL